MKLDIFEVILFWFKKITLRFENLCRLQLQKSARGLRHFLIVALVLAETVNRPHNNNKIDGFLKFA